ncbi:MAG: 4-hydroxythreonine-4-phosphate dehydrogenase PdxA [Planctomycetota bacterium]
MDPKIVVPQGDLGGIAPEVLLNSLASEKLRSSCHPVILGHIGALRTIAKNLGIDIALEPVATAKEGFAVSTSDAVPVLELENAVPNDPPGRPAASFGMASVEAVLRAASLCLEGSADAMVTPPIHKESVHLAGFPFEGQTQMIGEACRSRRYGMLACAGNLQVLVATRHMSLRDALERLDPQFVAKQIRIAHEAARETLGIASPRVVLAGLNPHASEGGAFGDEESKILEPAIAMARQEWGFETAGPAVPDVVFAEGVRGDWDVVVALYHDQAFLPLKMLPRESSYTVFVGGPVLRTSPMHGAAYDIARSGTADFRPFSFALEQAIVLAGRRIAAAPVV